MNDWDLLQRYVREQSEEAFADLVSCYLGLVYSAALRQVRSPELAEEVAQSVFTDLAATACKLRPDTVLSAWLYQVTRRTAIDAVRRESRRRSREQLAQEMMSMDASTTDWSQIEPLLDEAMAELDETDRSAVLLRFFENKPLREVGERLGTSEDAAQKRVSRAVERLRAHFSKRGITMGASGLAAVLSANAAQSAPAGLSVLTVAKAALAGAAVHHSTTIGLTKVIAMTTAQKTMVGAIIVAALAAGIYEAREASSLKRQVATLRQQAQVSGSRPLPNRQAADLDAARIADLQQENEQLLKELADLPRLRGELARLRAAEKRAGESGSDPSETEVKRWLARVERLKQRLTEKPEAGIPEFALLTEQEWLDAAKGKLETEEDFRRAMSDLRRAGENKFATLLRPALSVYMQSNDWRFPTGLAQLQPHFKKPVDLAILERYAILPSSAVENVKVGGEWIITQKEPVDAEYDTQLVIGPSGYGSTTFKANSHSKGVGKLHELLAPALKAYAAANSGHEPLDPEQLRPYLTTPQQQSALEKVLELRKEQPEEQ